ncbi:MAG: prepilin-type N-terminal cleavage/methylation domain-containing protein [Proteobacteria bacterium]|nr:prepilin-type N-terminal cleavage/methylation domain-containing protein [Pseudomonadota bacterium]
MKNKSSAFSLIELSIVILIIGVLVAGVTQASRLVRQSKLTTARTLTQSSGVNSIRGLILWLEPTMESSFKSTETSDASSLSNWYDINPQVSLRNTFSNSSATILYKASATNSLPAVYFNNVNTAFTGTIIDAPYNAYTIFYVARPTSLASTGFIFYNGTQGTNGIGVSLSTGGLTTFSYGASLSSVGSLASTANQVSADIVCITTAPNSLLGVAVTTPAILSYKNGVSNTMTAATTTAASWVTPTGSLYIGNATSAGTTTDFVGEISEIIIFDNVLKKTDRQEVEKYLSRKYGIAVTQS